MRGTIKKLIPYMLELDDTKIYEVKEYKEKRNLDQNAKYWKLLNELALTLKISVEELHFKMLKDLSKEKLVIVVTHDEEFASEYGDIYLELKEGKLNEIFNENELRV